MIINNLRLRLLLLTKRDLPQLDSLIGASCYQHLLVAIVSSSYLFTKHVGYIVFMGWELLHCRSLVEAEEVDFIVHACESVGALTKCTGSCQATL